MTRGQRRGEAIKTTTKGFELVCGLFDPFSQSVAEALKLDRRNVNEMWKKYFRPKYGPTERYRGVSSHYGRHYFTSWWRVEQDVSRPLIKYMRGDKQSGGDLRNSREAIDSYVHAYYEDIEPLYRREIFKFRL